MDSITTLFTNLTTTVTTVAFAVCVFFVAIGGIIYATAAGSPRQAETGKAAIVNALMGLAIVLGARTIVGLISAALGGAA